MGIRSTRFVINGFVGNNILKSTDLLIFTRTSYLVNRLNNSITKSYCLSLRNSSRCTSRYFTLF